jgi:hypothetical protein
VLVDFAGNGAAVGDVLSFVGFGGGATFTEQDATHWVPTYNGGASTEVITLQNGAPVDASAPIILGPPRATGVGYIPI